MFEEEQSLIKENKQIWGLYSSQIDVYPIKEIETVDERRKEIGHPPLWYMEKVYGMKLPNNYKSTGEL